MTNYLNEVKTTGTTRLTARIILEKNGLIKHLGYGKFELTTKGNRAIAL